jgi:hypothetical protein
MPENVKMKKETILKILKEKLEAHKLIYEKAFVAYRENYVKLLHDMLSAVKIKKFEHYINLSKPVSYEKDYKRAIKMIELDCREEIVLSEKEFANYVLNQWDWMPSFRSSYYSNVSSSSSSSKKSSSSNSKEQKIIDDYLETDD